ncbi:hypothetical protein RRG08_067035 [Elysia crispata]|uniref:Uncharacterized protein n=1 Tax=Elysia crispata TaxID=231223 RepID=A0AAE1DPN8_9GAST|nr:hypothetical protein RRG08_067035 [Elysia crispata]
MSEQFGSKTYTCLAESLQWKREAILKFHNPEGLPAPHQPISRPWHCLFGDNYCCTPALYNFLIANKTMCALAQEERILAAAEAKEQGAAVRIDKVDNNRLRGRHFLGPYDAQEREEEARQKQGTCHVCYAKDSK